MPYTLPSLTSIAVSRDSHSSKIPPLPMPCENPDTSPEPPSEPPQTALYDHSPELVTGKRQRVPNRRSEQYDQELVQKNQARQRKAVQKIAAQPPSRTSVHIPTTAVNVRAPAAQGDPSPTDHDGQRSDIESEDGFDDADLEEASVHEAPPSVYPINDTYDDLDIAPRPLSDAHGSSTSVTPLGPSSRVNHLDLNTPHATAQKRTASSLLGGHVMKRPHLDSVISTPTHSTPSPRMTISPVAAPPSQPSDAPSPATAAQPAPTKGRSKIRPSIGRTKDEDDSKGYVLELACDDFKAYMAAAMPFPEGETLLRLAEASWSRANAQANPDRPAYPYSTDIRRVIVARAPQFRGALRDYIAPLIRSTYRLRMGLNELEEKTNRYLIYRLREQSTFVCGEYQLPPYHDDWSNEPQSEEKTDRSYWYENSIIQDVVNRALFPDRDGLGVQFADWFTPMELPTIALIITTIEHCLDEYSSGIRIKKRLNATHDASRFKLHLSNLRKFEEKNPNRCLKLRKALTQTGRLHAQVEDDLHALPTAQLTEADFGPDEESGEE